MKLIQLLTATMLAVTMAFTAYADEPKDKVTAGFIYVGPTGDHGWTYRHDIGRQDVEKHFGDRVETIFVESVKYGPDATRVMRQMAMKGVDIIFATSFGYMDSMLKVAEEFPNVKFEHATGYKTAPNMANYGLKLYQARHVQGVIAGMMTKTNKICYVAAYPIPEVIREINTYYLGAKSVNPDVDIDIVWVMTWYDPGKEADAAKALLSQGCDIIAQHTDSPAPIQVAEQQGKFGFGQASDQYRFAPKSQLTATIDNWSPYYIAKVQAVLDGTWTTGTYFGDISECDATGCAVGMAPFTNMPDDVKAKAQEIKDAISKGEYFAFTGPLKDNSGKLRLADGEIADRAHLDTMNYYVEGIDATVPD
jgi:simple sugar transport system substrate-binding protein